MNVIMPSCKKSLIVEQFQGNYLKGAQSQYNVCILSYFGHVKNYPEFEGDLKIVVYEDRKTPKR